MQKIIPHLWYDKDALEAAVWYTELFEDSKIIETSILTDTPSGDTQTVDFQLAGMRFSAISAGPYFSLNPSISLMVACAVPEEVDRLHASLSDGGDRAYAFGCKDQAEIDYFWDKLSAVPESEQCGWVRDQFGLSWQIVPAHMDEIMAGATEEGRRRVMDALLNMKKLDIAALEKARAEK